MADQATFQVKNCFKNDIQVSRAMATMTDLNATISYEQSHDVLLPGTEPMLIINTPQEIDMRDYGFRIGSDVDLIVTYSRSLSQLTIQINPNQLPPTAPTTVNVNVGEDRPG